MGEICGIDDMRKLQLTEGTEKALRKLFTTPPPPWTVVDPENAFVMYEDECAFNLAHGYMWGRFGV